jgi:hypothetical protein
MNVFVVPPVACRIGGGEDFSSACEKLECFGAACALASDSIVLSKAEPCLLLQREQLLDFEAAQLCRGSMRRERANPDSVSMPCPLHDPPTHSH